MVVSKELTSVERLVGSWVANSVELLDHVMAEMMDKMWVSTTAEE